MGGISPIVLTVTMLTLFKSGSPIGTGTGFFYSRDNRLFLVTNQHVFRDAKKNSFPDSFRLTLHTDASDVRKTVTYDLNIYKGSTPLWKVHPNFLDADVALIEITDPQFQKNHLIKAWTPSNLFPKNYRLDPGEDVFIIGYPLSFQDKANHLPIFRNAMVASTYGVHFNGNPYFLTDANLHEGTSGSPVITKPKNVWIDDQGNTNMVTGTVYYFVGVHSGVLALKSSSGEPIGLGASWYASLVDDIAALP